MHPVCTLLTKIRKCVPSDTIITYEKWLWNNCLGEKLRISRVIPWERSLSFLEILRVQEPSKIPKHNSRGVIFVINSCQRAFCRERGNRALVKAIFRLGTAIKNSVFEASKLVSTKTLLLKHYYRHQGLRAQEPSKITTTLGEVFS